MPITIAIASGKGGTGKTLVATCLFHALASSSHKAAFLDCDVETPNAALFLNPALDSIQKETVLRPKIDESKCIECGKCAAICYYKAISLVRSKPMLFPELCHGCGGCSRVCPVGAIEEIEQEIGTIESGIAYGMPFFQGRLRVSEALSPILISRVKKAVPEVEVCCIDCAPGTACSLVASLVNVDLALLVAESTPFGLHDLRLAVDVCQKMRIPIALFINRVDSNQKCAISAYCEENNFPIVGQLPESKTIASLYAQGKIATEDTEAQSVFNTLVKKLIP